MEAGHAMAAGSSRRDWRLDPQLLPVAFRAHDAHADGRTRLVELSRETVVVRRKVAGIGMAVSRPLSDFLGVAIRLLPPADGVEGAIAIVLEHRDPALRVPLLVASSGEYALGAWRQWGRSLEMPLLTSDISGALKPCHAPAVRHDRRKRRHLRQRRPSFLMRRKPPLAQRASNVHRGEREIVARS